MGTDQGGLKFGTMVYLPDGLNWKNRILISLDVIGNAGHASNAARHRPPLEALLNDEVIALIFQSLCAALIAGYPLEVWERVSFILMLFKLGKSITNSQAQVHQTRSRPADSFSLIAAVCCFSD